MSGRIPRQFIDELLLRVDIVDLIDSRVPLKKTGNNFVARCPFHTEKTPSFNVNRQRQIYHCFGCGASGNAIGFLMAFNHLEFVEAVEDLSAFVGLEVPRETVNNAEIAAKQDLSRLYEELARVAEFYAEQLRTEQGKAAIAYLKARGVSGELARDFNLGYAPDSWDALLTRFDEKSLLDSGMLVKNDSGKCYDRFRGRLMFPIRDKRKRVIGFGGRVLDDSLPKYLNSPETAIFSKGKELYGLCELLEKQSKPLQILVVEGYMDVIALAQFGVFNAVAALGTATSKVHIDLLFRFTPEIVFCFDGDQAGKQAAWKATETALPCLRDGRQVKIMLLPVGHDPDSLIRLEGAEGFGERMRQAQVLSDYFFEHLSAGLNIRELEGRAKFLATAKPLLEKMPGSFFREMMFVRLQELSGVKRLDISENRATLTANQEKKPPALRKAPKSNLMRKVLALLLQYPHLAKLVEPHLSLINVMNFAGVDLLQDVLRVINTGKPENSGMLLEMYRNSPHNKVVLALSNLDFGLPDGGEEGELAGALTQLVKSAKESRMTALIEKVARGEGLTPEEMLEYKSGGK